VGYTVERLSDDRMEEVRRLRREKGSEFEVGALHAWANGTADVEQRRQIASAIEFQETKR
jgi:hypothetical protein